MVPTIKVFAGGFCIIFFLLYFSIKDGGDISPEKEFYLEGAAYSGGATKYLVFNGTSYAIPVTLWSHGHNQNMFYHLEKGEIIKVRFDQRNVLAAVQARGEVLMDLQDYEHWKAVTSKRWGNVALVLAIVYLAALFYERKRKSS